MRQLHAGCKIRQEEWAAAEGKVVISGDDSRKAYLKSVQDKQSTGLARLSLIVGNLPQTENRPEAFNQVGATDAGDCQHTQ